MSDKICLIDKYLKELGFKNDIVNSLKTIEVYHPAYYARTGKKMPSSVFTDINQALKQQYNYQIEFYKETEYGTC